MAGIRLAEGCTVLTCAIVPAAQVAWHEAQTDDQGAVTKAAHGAVVLTVAGDADALPGTENGSAKLTPFSLYLLHEHKSKRQMAFILFGTVLITVGAVLMGMFTTR